MLIAQAAGEYLGVSLATVASNAVSSTGDFIRSLDPFEWVVIGLVLVVLSFLFGRTR